MKWVVYETIKKDEPNKNYIGKSFKSNVENGYMGSGNDFKDAEYRYGKEMFKTSILEYFDTEKEALLYETKILREKGGYYNTATVSMNDKSKSSVDRSKDYYQAKRAKAEKHITTTNRAYKGVPIRVAEPDKDVLPKWVDPMQKPR